MRDMLLELYRVNMVVRSMGMVLGWFMDNVLVAGFLGRMLL